MEYGKAQDIRKQGLFGLITDKLVSGQGIGSSIKSGLSERTQATFTGIKEKFDPLNIAKKMTGGSALAPALLGRLTNRDQSTIEHFTGKKAGKIKSTDDSSSSMVDVLGLILRSLQRAEAEKTLEKEKEKLKSEEEEQEEDRRNSELISALTGKKKSAKKGKKDKVEIKKEPKKTPPKKETKKTTAKKETAPISKTAATAAVAVPTAAKIAGAAILGASGISAAAAISIKGETGKGDIKSKKDIIDKAGQVVPNDPKPGVTSYGIFGMNSAAGTVQQFVAENPQFGLTAKPATSEFDKQWKDVAAKKGDEFLDAQLVWHDRHILQPLRSELSTKLPKGVQLNEQILAYMADRRIQYGTTQEKSALQYASTASTPVEWINKMTEYDVSNIGTAFSTYLKTHPGAEKGLLRRLEIRKSMALSVASDSSVGNKLNSSSKENKDLKKPTEQPAPMQKNLNTTNISSTINDASKTEEVDDTNAYLKKVRLK